MSRIRSIHPGVWTDDAFMGLSAHARLLAIGLWTEAFDDGVFEWKPLTLKARIFPADNISVADLLAELVDAGLIRKDECDGRAVGLVRNFRRFQRPKKPNSSGLMKPEWGEYVGISDDAPRPVPHQFPTSTEKSPQMEDGGGRMEDENTKPPAPSSEPVGARDIFDEVLKAFPANPSSSETKAMAAFSATKAADRPMILAAAQRYGKWFAEDCAARKRTLQAGLRFAPHLSTWVESGAWREAGKLPISDEPGPIVPMVRLNRERDHALWSVCERVSGKRAATDGLEWSFKAEIVAKAKKELGMLS